MEVRVLYFEGCPHAQPAIDLVSRVANEIGVCVDFELVKVAGAAQAESHRFLGSPTIQVNGIDIDPTARARSDFAFSCRIYGDSGTPPREMVEAALKEGIVS